MFAIFLLQIPKMPKPRGKEWDHVKVLTTGQNNYKVQCNYCEKQFWIGSGNRIRSHLGVESLSGVTKCEKVPETVTTAFKKSEDKKIADSFDALKRKRVTSTSQHALSSSNFTSFCDPKQSKISAAVAERSKAEVDEAVARMCYIQHGN